MKIKGANDLSEYELTNELRNGGKLVTYQYCISILVMTFKRSSDIYLIKSEESAFVKGLGYTLISFILGWWGFPWGPIYTVSSIVTNCRGGKDVTQEIIPSFSEV